MIKGVKSKMGKNRIIEMYKKGFSIDYISRKYYKSINKNKKPIKINGMIILPTKIYNLSYCRMFVSEVIYDYTIKEYKTSSIV